MSNEKSRSRLKRTLRFLVFAGVVLGTLIVLAYAAVGFWGRREWAAAQAEMRAKGEALDIAALTPPGLPDEDNFFATPLWMELTEPTIEKRNQRLLKFKEALGGSKDGALPWVGRGREIYKKPFNFEEIFKFYQKIGVLPPDEQGLPPAQAILDSIDSGTEQLLAELRLAGPRSGASFPIEYEKGLAMSLPHLPHLMTVAKYLQLHAALEGALGRRDKAEQDVSLIFRLARSIQEEPMLILYLVRLAVLQTGTLSIWEGIFEQSWTEDQLGRLQGLLEGIELKEGLTQALRGERAFLVQTVEPFTRGGDMFQFANYLRSQDEEFDRVLPSLEGIYRAYPKGLLFDDLAYYTSTMQGIIEAAARSDVRQMDEVVQGALRNQMPGTRLFTRLCLPTIYGVRRKMLETEVRISQAVIGCALERYRVANGAYPEELAKIPNLPVDPMSGEPFRYRRTPDGGYVLWSLGPDGNDDQGKPVENSSNVSAKGDWVWTMPGRR